MNKDAKVGLVIALFVLVGVGGYYFAVIKKRSTEAQFNSFKEKSLKSGADILLNISAEKEAEAKAKWLKNLKKDEAERLIQMAEKKEKDMSASELIELKQLMIKWLKSIKS